MAIATETDTQPETVTRQTLEKLLGLLCEQIQQWRDDPQAGVVMYRGEPIKAVNDVIEVLSRPLAVPAFQSLAARLRPTATPKSSSVPTTGLSMMRAASSPCIAKVVK